MVRIDMSEYMEKYSVSRLIGAPPGYVGYEEDGRITDSQGRTVDFKNTILILTSNLGSQYILEGIQDGEVSAEARAKVDALLKQSFRPEFLNRLDEIVVYKPLTKAEIGGVVELQLKKLRSRLADKQLELEITDRAKEYIIDNGYDPIYGARPLKRYIQSKVETLIARCIIRGEPAEQDTLVVDADDTGLTLTVQKPVK